jgi:FixJ family two-component response regulator
MADTRPLIAIIDDEQSVRIALRRLCNAYGMATRTFRSAEELVASIDDQRPDCLVLDAHMPGIGSLAAQAWLHEHGIAIPAVVITGRDDPEMRARSIAGGACAYLCKPIDADILIGAIERAIGDEHVTTETRSA